MGLSPFQYREMLSRLERNTRTERPADATAPERESELAEEIRKWCESQWPRVKRIVARTDKRSTIEEGAHDQTLFLPGGRVLCLELKSRTGKRTEKQLAWAAEMKMCGHSVHCIRTFEEFLGLVRTSEPESQQGLPGS